MPVYTNNYGFPKTDTQNDTPNQLLFENQNNAMDAIDAKLKEIYDALRAVVFEHGVANFTFTGVGTQNAKLTLTKFKTLHGLLAIADTGFVELVNVTSKVDSRRQARIFIRYTGTSSETIPVRWLAYGEPEQPEPL